MLVYLQSFTIMINLFLLFTECYIIAKQSVYSGFRKSCKHAYKAGLGFSVLLLIAYNLKTLFHSYNKSTWGFEGTYITNEIRTLQYLAENVFRSIFIFSFDFILKSIYTVKIKDLYDKETLRPSILIYGLGRIVPAFTLIFALKSQPAFFSYVMEIVMVAEGFVISMLLFALIKHFIEVQKELLISSLPEKPHFEIETNDLLLITKKCFFGILFESFARFLLVFVMVEKKSKLLLFLIDISNLIKLISLVLIILSINKLIFKGTNVDDALITGSSTKSFSERFFLFDSESDGDFPIIRG